MNRSIQLREQFLVNRPLADVFNYLSDFSTIAEWDASVFSCQKISDGPIGVGTKFDLILKSAGRHVAMDYTLKTYQTQHLVFEGVAKDFVAIDSIWFKESTQGTEITWQADISFTGLLAHLLPIMKPALLKLGQTSMRGLAQALANNNPPPLMQHQIRSQLILPELWQFTKFGYLQAQNKWLPVSNNMQHKHIVITGATSGLGLASAFALAQKGCQLTLVVRNTHKGQDITQQIIKQTGNTNIHLEIADMSLMNDVIALTERLTQQRPIDVLINNAGALFNPRKETSEGLEQSFALLLLSPFILTQQLKPLFAHNARVVNVLSGGMYSQAVNVDDLESKRGAYSGSVSYAKAKRGLMIITEEWAKQWQKDGIVVHAMHPGWANTDGVINALPEFYKLSKNVLRSPQQGADTIIWLASATEVSQSTGLFWLDREPRPTHLTTKTQETPLQRAQLWQSLLRYEKKFLSQKCTV